MRYQFSTGSRHIQTIYLRCFSVDEKHFVGLETCLRAVVFLCMFLSCLWWNAVNVKATKIASRFSWDTIICRIEIIVGSQKFGLAYRDVFGDIPDPDFYPRAAVTETRPPAETRYIYLNYMRKRNFSVTHLRHNCLQTSPDYNSLPVST